MVLLRHETVRSRRPIKLQSWIVALRRDLQTKASQHDLVPDAHDLVFRTPTGEPINADYLAKHFKSMLALIVLQRIRLYDLRYSAAMIALAAGVSVHESNDLDCLSLQRTESLEFASLT